MSFFYQVHIYNLFLKNGIIIILKFLFPVIKIFFMKFCGPSDTKFCGTRNSKFEKIPYKSYNPKLKIIFVEFVV